jgi:thiol-disulfide isomerase/thioredoxin
LLVVATVAGATAKNNSALGGQWRRDRDSVSAPTAKSCPTCGPLQVVAWTGPGCSRCAKDKPELLRLQKECGWIIMFIDYYEQKELGKSYKIRQFPTYFVVVDNEVVFRTISLKKLKAYQPPKKDKKNAPPPN